MPKHSITLCCVDCVNIELAIKALRVSAARFAFQRVILFTDVMPADPPADIEVMLIPPIRSKRDYSWFLVKGLQPHIATSHVLVVQWDGFVTDASAWEDAFFDYDYIGAPWPADLSPYPVGNGGFSLRSKKLLDALLDPRIAQEQIFHEDRSICVDFRELLERDYQIRFPGEALASRFSFETSYNGQPTFGFHGVQNLGHFWNGDDLRFFLKHVSRPVLRQPEIVWLVRHLYADSRLQDAARVAGSILGEQPDQMEVLDILANLRGKLRTEDYLAHPEQRFFIGYIKRHLAQYFRQKTVLEVGSRNIGGSVREWFEQCNYVGVDDLPGKDVDQQIAGAAYAAGGESFDVIISSEWLEHDPYWRETLLNTVRMLKRNGMLLLTFAGPGRQRHQRAGVAPGENTASSYYRNLSMEDVRTVEGFGGWFSLLHTHEDHVTHDVYLLALGPDADQETQTVARKLAADMNFLNHKRNTLGIY